MKVDSVSQQAETASEVWAPFSSSHTRYVWFQFGTNTTNRYFLTLLSNTDLSETVFTWQHVAGNLQIDFILLGSAVQATSTLPPGVCTAALQLRLT